jgi:WD40 repeat protein
MERTTKTPRGPVLIALALSVISLCAWLVFVGSRNGPIDRRVSSIALSRAGRWLAGGTSQGRITLWDLVGRTAPRQIEFRQGPMNDLQFSPDEAVLAIAGKDLAIYNLEHSAALGLLRSDERNYGTVRFTKDGETVLVITGKAEIETLDTRSGATRLKVCCSSIYGEVTFTPDGMAIGNAGHWPSVWDARSGQLLGRFTTSRQFYTFRPIAFDGARRTILMGSQDGRVYVLGSHHKTACRNLGTAIGVRRFLSRFLHGMGCVRWIRQDVAAVEPTDRAAAFLACGSTHEQSDS